MKDQKQNRNKQAIEANTQDGGKVTETTKPEQTAQKSRENHKANVVFKNVMKQRQAKQA